MATASNINAFAQQIRQLAVAYERTPAQVVAASGRVYRETISREIGSVTRGSKLRNVGKRGSRVGVRLTVNNSTATVQATGPLQIIERDTKDHTIPRTALTRRTRTKSGRASRKRELTGRTASGRRPLFINGEWVLGPVPHPGTTGKHPFERGEIVARVPASLAANAVKQQAILGVFR